MSSTVRTASAVALICLFVGHSAWAQTGEWRVGPPDDPDCNFADIQSAIDATKVNDGGGTAVNIRVSGDAALHRGNTYVIDADEFDAITTFRIIGGHDSCAASSPAANNRTVLDADDNGRVFHLTYDVGTDAPVREVELRNLEIRNGNADFAGGGMRIEGHAGLHRVRLFNVLVESNRTNNNGSGGGISLEATAVTESPVNWFSTDGNTLIHNNFAVGSGGGLACFNLTGTENPPVLLFNTRVSSNTAESNGGGVLVTGCHNVNIRSAGFNNAVSLNIAGVHGDDGDGGGLFINAGGEVTVEASGTVESAIIEANTAGRGGGLAIEGEDSQALLVNTRVIHNHARNDGGGLFVTDNADLTMGRVGGVVGFAGDCQPNAGNGFRCSVIANNSANGDGGGIGVTGDGAARLYQTFLHSNASDGGRGSAAFADGTQTALDLEGAVVHSNRDSIDLFHVRGDARLQFHWGTIAGNRQNDDSLRVFRVVTGSSFSRLVLTTSIIWEPGAALVSQAGDPFTSNGCLIGHLPYEDSGLDIDDDFNTYYSFIDPRLRDPQNGDLRLRLDSPAVDYCDLTVDPEFRDMFDNPRGVDVGGPLTEPPNPPNGDHDFDIGAHELQSLEIDIFSDRFES